jgi:hypothetical protein
MGYPLGHFAGVHEDQGGAVLARVLGDPVEHVGKLQPARHGFELTVGELDRHVQVAGMPAVDDHRRLAVGMHAGEEAGHDVQGPLGGREPDALQVAAGLAHQAVQPFEAQGQVAATLVPRQRVHLVDDDGAYAAQHGPRRRRGQQQVERFGRRDQNVGRVLAHGGPFGGRRIAGADGDAQPGVAVTKPSRLVADFGEGHVQVLVDVDGEGAQRGDIENLGEAALTGPGIGGSIGGIDGHQEPGQGLAGPGG